MDDTVVCGIHLIHVQNTEWSHAHDRLQATEYWIWQKVCTIRNCESGYSSVKQSSRYFTHGLYGCAAYGST